MCEHTSTIDDIRQGDVVCLDCGLVLDKIYQHEPLKPCSFSIEEYLLTVNENRVNDKKLTIKKKNKCLNEETALLVTLFDKLHLNNKIKDTILEEWKKIKDWLL